MESAEKAQDAEIFRRETAARGGPFRRDSAPAPGKAGYDAIAERAEDLIACARRATEGLPPIHFDFILNPKINAVAFRVSDRYFIGINTGTLYMLRMVIRRMLSDARAFPSIGDPSEEVGDLKPIAGYLPDADAMYQANPILTPRNDMRHAYAEFLEDQAIMFFIGHEIAHISLGHVDYLQDRRRLGQTIELSSFPIDDAEVRLERQCLEIDADRRSIMSRIDSLRVTQQSPDYIGPEWVPEDKGPERIIRDWVVSISIVFRLFGDVQFTGSELSEASYPPLPIRRVYAELAGAGTIENYWDPGLIASVRVAFNEARKETEEAFATILGGPVTMAGLRQALSPSGREHATRLEEYWNSTLMERLRPYSYEF